MDLTVIQNNSMPSLTRGLPINIKHSHNAGLLLGQRRRRWTNIKAELFECFVFTVLSDVYTGSHLALPVYLSDAYNLLIDW